MNFVIQNRSSSNCNGTSSNSNSAKNQNHVTKKEMEKKAKLHILGPSVFKKQLYDIPEYQSTTDNNKKIKEIKDHLEQIQN